MLSTPLPPPARFLLWVNLWVRRYSLSLLEIEFALCHPEHRIVHQPGYTGKIDVDRLTIVDRKIQAIPTQKFEPPQTNKGQCQQASIDL